MAKTVTIASGTIFETLTAAKEHFSKLREANPVDTRLSEPDKSDALDVYKRYCAATDWPVVNAIDVTTAWENTKRADGTYAQTKAFALITESGASHIFSMDKALTAIAI